MVAAVLVLVAILLPTPSASADDVYLTNGRVFEDVVARTEGERVAIRMAHGLIRIPAVRVARIERGETPLAEYLRRLATLESQPEGGGAAAWIELARWARDHGLASAYRQAATIAAALDPRAEGLAPLMRDLDLFFDESAERWMGEAELMGRRGLVRYEGAWVTPEQRSAAQARLTEAEARRLEARGEAQRDQALVELASAVRAQAEANAAEERRRDPFDTSLPFAYYSPGWWVVPVPGHGHDRGDDRGGHDDGTPPPAQHTRPANGGGFRASDWIPGKLNPGAAPPPGRISATARSATRR
jgi:hypothetical protein